MRTPLPTCRLMLAVACIAVSVVAADTSPIQRIDQPERDAALRLFHERVEHYAALHRRLEGPLPPLTTTRNMLKVHIARQLLANAIRRARSDAHQGAIFSSDVAPAFRRLIAEALAGQDVEVFLMELQVEHPALGKVRLEVNEPLPSEATHEMPIVLLRVLPALPEDVEYRIVNRSLVLWDIHANLVVDYLPNAFAPVETTLLR